MFMHLLEIYTYSMVERKKYVTYSTRYICRMKYGGYRRYFQIPLFSNEAYFY